MTFGDGAKQRASRRTGRLSPEAVDYRIIYCAMAHLLALSGMDARACYAGTNTNGYKVSLSLGELFNPHQPNVHQRLLPLQIDTSSFSESNAGFH